ncbi:MAG: UDP-N-acetylglucosamine pyrophosphorylase [Lachnospiraceae bacterium]|nr:UDP-N-acetylglucosamine pyrophosphorylase [Lachnospiraceae bacterium]
MEACKIENLYDLSATLAGNYLKQLTYPWEALDHIKDWVLEIGPTLDESIYEKRGDDIWVARSAKIYPTATLIGPLIIGEDTEVRPGAFIRGSAIIGSGCVIGNSTEIKNDIIFDHVQVPHYNYVGDSILGTYSHMGAGSITSNVKSDKTPVVVKYDGEWIDTGRKKFGAMLGDHVEVGCNTVLNPGTVVGRNSTIYPVSMVRGVIPADSIYKNKSEFEIVSKDTSK